MPAKKVNKSKARVAKSKSSTFQFRFWMAAVIVLVVAIAGLAVLKFSQAKGDYTSIYNARVGAKAQPYGITVLNLQPGGNWAYVKTAYGNGSTWQRDNGNGSYSCAHIYKGNYFKDGAAGWSAVAVGDTVTVKEYNGQATGAGARGCAY